MIDSPKTTNPPSSSDSTAHADAELLALGEQMDVLIREFRESSRAWAIFDDAMDRGVEELGSSPTWSSLGDDQKGAAIEQIRKQAVEPEIRHMDDITTSMHNGVLKITGLPAFTIAGLAVKARLAKFNCNDFYDEADEDNLQWDRLCARKLIDSVIQLARDAVGNKSALDLTYWGPKINEEAAE